MRIDKAALKAHLLSTLDATRSEAAQAQRAAQEGATHEEARAESDKDMRSTETSYIARGQAIRVVELDAERARVAAMSLRDYGPDDPIGAGALVTIADASAERTVFVAPGGGGLVLRVGKATVHVVTPTSPLGQALVGAHVGDDLTVERGGREEELAVVALA